MSNFWVTSDTHFNHYGIIGLAKRPFASVKEMNECLVTNWNETVKPNDIVFHLGDVIWESGDQQKDIDLLESLHGTKHLIVGNHDNINDNSILPVVFKSLQLWMKYKSVKTIFSHLPINTETWEIDEQDYLNCHGHIHDRKSPTKGRFKNLCVEWTDYKPVAWEEATSWATPT